MSRLSAVVSFRSSVSALRSNLLIPLLSFVLFSACLPGLVRAETADAPDKRSQAVNLFEQAVQARTMLEGKPKRLRKATEYQKVIDQFRSVYYQFPVSSKADDALLAVAELYQSMGSDFAEGRYFLRAVQAYVFLEKEYPASPHGSIGLFTAAEIYLNDLGDPKLAQETFKEFLTKYPTSGRARNARARLDDLRTELRQASGRGVKKTEATARSSPVENVREQAKAGSETSGKLLVTESQRAETQAGPRQVSSSKSESQRPGATDSKSADKSVVLRDLRYWNSEGHTRIVIGTENDAKYIQGTLENPARVFVDVLNARLAAELDGRSFSLNDGYVKKVRFGQPKTDVARVVIDIESIQDCKVSTLSSPARIVIDLSGKNRKSADSPAQVASNSVWKVKRGEPLADELELRSTRTRADRAEKKERDKQIAVLPASTENKRGSVLQGDTDRKVPAAPAEAAVESEAKPLQGSRASLPKSDGTRSLIRTLGLKVGRIVIDPGHGGHDTGTIGPSGLQEKDLVLDIALKLKKLVEERLGSEVVLTRDDDTFIPLEERTAIANQSGADLFLSVHANSSHNRRVSGIETFFLNFASSSDAAEIAARENSSSQKTVFELQDLVQKIALREKVDESRELAQIVQKSMAAHLQKARSQTKDRGVKQAPFIVLIGANMPSILSEVSFVSNPADEKLLKSSNYRQKVAEALCQGIEAYAEALGGIKTARKLP